MDFKNIFEKYHLTHTEQNVLEYLIDHIDESLTIRALAEATHVSAALIVKMAQKMKLSGYSELVYHMRQMKQNFTDLQENQTIKEHGDAFLELLTEYQDKLIAVVGIGYSNNLSNYIADYLNLYGFRSTSNFHHQFLRETHSEELLIIFVSNSGNTTELYEYAEEAYEKDIDYVLLTGNPDSKMQHHARYTICTNDYFIFRYTEYKPQLFFGNILITFEKLMAYTLHNL